MWIDIAAPNLRQYKFCKLRRRSNLYAVFIYETVEESLLFLLVRRECFSTRAGEVYVVEEANLTNNT